MRFERSAGILLHPTSLPGPHGIGDLGPEAHRFVDFLADAGCGLWQVLPLGPTGFRGSPYQPFSAFAGNQYLVSPDALIEEGLLRRDDIPAAGFPPDRVDFGLLLNWKLALLDRAWHRFGESAKPALGEEFAAFRAANAAWLEDYSLFMALKAAHGRRAWNEWPDPLRRRWREAIGEARRAHAGAQEQVAFRQFLFFRQWAALRAHAAARGVKIVGDLPIFVAFDSADVWSRPELFLLDDDGRPTSVAGVPPDYFAPTGQLWGNPLYRWEAHARTGYAWWMERVEIILKLCDIVRLDHFRGYAAYWAVPAGDPTAERGRWVEGPGAAFMQALKDRFGDLPFIAEDLGHITPDVVALRERFVLPGMKVLQFAFSGPDNPFLPHHYARDCAVYTGTHDNDTSAGWYASAPPAVRAFCDRYLGRDGRGRRAGGGAAHGDIAHDMMRAAWASVAALAIAPIQDLLGLDSSARMNHPGAEAGSWTWRMSAGLLTDDRKTRLLELNELYGRAVSRGGGPGSAAVP